MTNKQTRLIEGDAVSTIIWLLSNKNIDINCRHITRAIANIGLASPLLLIEDILVEILM